MNIGTIIKQNRRQRDMTQEELAEYLNVSVSAVSQWEGGKTTPDLSLIPGICSLFHITSDELLGIDLANKEARIDEISRSASRYYTRGYMDEGRRILEEGLREFPDSWQLICDLMYVAHIQSDLKPSPALDEAISLGERILAGCTEEEKRHAAIQTLCYCCKARGEADRAVKLAQTMPILYLSRESLMCHVTDGSKHHHAKQVLDYNLIDEMGTEIVFRNTKLDDGSWAYNPEEMALLRDKQIAFFALLFEDGDYGFFHCRLSLTHQHQAEYFAGLGDRERTLHHIEAAADHAIAFVGCEGVCEHTSLLLRGYRSGSMSTTGSKTDTAERLEELSRKRYDFVRDEPRFAAVVERLKTVAGRWEVK
ncbi:MAG: helix-turn-helix domain-containing protein [Clostridia bacterium]|nr:helix-turn-helix domain-containing protein [Clostridia bacterium]